jgi:ribosome-associated toxin RatA of RatAB toxin-antitoxin module
MAEQTTGRITIQAPPDAVMAVIADFESYPEWTGAVRRAEVVSRLDDGRGERVHYVLDAGAIKDEYTLAYDWSKPDTLRWHLVEGGMLRALDGSYELSDNGDGSTDVTYTLAVDVKVPLLGMIKRKAEKVIIDTALKELKKRVEHRLGL